MKEYRKYVDITGYQDVIVRQGRVIFESES